MSDKKHTPTPWRLSADGGAITTSKPGILEGSKTICGGLDNPLKDQDECKANAEFIVTACNSHDELLDTLNRISLLCGTGESSNKTRQIFQIAERAIDKVRIQA